MNPWDDTSASIQLGNADRILALAQSAGRISEEVRLATLTATDVEGSSQSMSSRFVDALLVEQHLLEQRHKLGLELSEKRLHASYKDILMPSRQAALDTLMQEFVMHLTEVEGMAHDIASRIKDSGKVKRRFLVASSSQQDFVDLIQCCGRFLSTMNTILSVCHHMAGLDDSMCVRLRRLLEVAEPFTAALEILVERCSQADTTQYT